jgi:two-component system, OmpR family, response regulator
MSAMAVLVVEDERKVAALVRAGLEEQGFSVETCHDGDTAWQLASARGYEALILDIMLPGRDGLSLLRKLRGEGNSVPVILLTARGDVNERIEGLELGADDYVGKPFFIGELVARLRAVLRRRTGTGLTVLSLADLTVNIATREIRRSDTRIELTPREFALLECLLRAHGGVVTRAEIAQQVWNQQFDPGTNFVDVAIQRLRRKIDDPFPLKLVQTIRGVGYALQAGS